MSPVQNVWRQLVQRRLWPLAILLVAALAAVPLTLAKEPDPVEAPPVVADTGDSELATKPIVAPAGTQDRAKRRHVLGKRKNPFSVDKPDESTEVVGGDATSDAGAGAGSGSGDTGGAPAAGGTAPSDPGAGVPSLGGGSVPVTEPPQPKPKTYEVQELTVAFGDSTAGTKRQSLKRLEPLPSAEQPVLIYLGVKNDGKTAVFLVDDGVSAIGDGDCKPSPDACETIGLKAGETEFLDVVDATGTVGGQYQLDLIKIHKSTTASASRAKAASKAGRRLLKAHVADSGPTGYRWDASLGALQRRPATTLRATVAGVTVALP